MKQHPSAASKSSTWKAPEQKPEAEKWGKRPQAVSTLSPLAAKLTDQAATLKNSLLVKEGVLERRVGIIQQLTKANWLRDFHS